MVEVSSDSSSGSRSISDFPSQLDNVDGKLTGELKEVFDPYSKLFFASYYEMATNLVQHKISLQHLQSETWIRKVTEISSSRCRSQAIHSPVNKRRDAQLIKYNLNCRVEGLCPVSISILPP